MVDMSKPTNKTFAALLNKSFEIPPNKRNTFVQRKEALAFAIDVFNLTIGGHHRLTHFVDGTELPPKHFPGRSSPITVESAGFVTSAKPKPGFVATPLGNKSHKSPPTTWLIHLLDIKFNAKAVTNASHAGANIPKILSELMGSPATEETAPLLGVDLGEVPWPLASFGNKARLHKDQKAFWASQWIKFSAADGDSARWTAEDEKADPGSKKWVGRVMQDEKPFGDGKLFLYVMHELRRVWRIVGSSTSFQYDLIAPDASMKEVSTEVTEWLRAKYKTLNQPAAQLTYSGAACLLSVHKCCKCIRSTNTAMCGCSKFQHLPVQEGSPQ